MKTTLIALIVAFVAAAQADVSTSRKYSDVTNYLHQLITQYPGNVEPFTLGFSNSGVAIEGVKIGSGPVAGLVVATHHGNEYASTEVALNFAEAIAQAPIEGQTIYVIPVLNIDGYNSRTRWERINGQYIDPNRDYPGPCGTEGPFHSRSTQALADFVARENIVTSATLHTYTPAVVFPWGISTHDTETPYTPVFLNLVNAATHASHYTVGNATDVIYPADGTYEDYAYWKHGIWSILFEMGSSHSPSVTTLKETVRVNVPGLRKMFEIAPQARAEKHAFEGQCNGFLRSLDLHAE